MFKEDTFHRSVVIDIDSMFSKSTYSLGHSYNKYADGDCKRLCDKLINCNFSQVTNSTSVDAAVNSPSAPVHYALIGLFPVVLSDKPNTLLGSLPRYATTIYARRIPSTRDLERKTMTVLQTVFKIS